MTRQTGRCFFFFLVLLGGVKIPHLASSAPVLRFFFVQFVVKHCSFPMWKMKRNGRTDHLGIILSPPQSRNSTNRKPMDGWDLFPFFHTPRVYYFINGLTYRNVYTHPIYHTHTYIIERPLLVQELFPTKSSLTQTCSQTLEPRVLIAPDAHHLWYSL